MAEYLIQENTLVEICDLLREKFNNYDSVQSLVSKRTGLTNNIIIPPNITSIGDGAFSFCYNLISIVVPDNVETIGRYAFAGCSELNDITFCCGLVTINYNAFSGVNSLKNISLRTSVPPTIPWGLFNSFRDGTIHVPVGSEETYKSATNWSAYAEYIVGDIIIEEVH